MNRHTIEKRNNPMPTDEEPSNGEDQPAESAAHRDGPLADLAERIESRRAERETALFEQVDVAAIDGEELLDDVIETPAEPDTAVDSTSGVSGHSSAANEDILNKRTYCQQCPYLSDPPNVSCEHENTDIIAVVDTDHFRVRGCPMVTEEGPRFKFERK